MSVPRVEDLLIARLGGGTGEPSAAVLDALSAAGLLDAEDRARWDSAVVSGDLPASHPAPPRLSRAELSSRTRSLLDERVAAGIGVEFSLLETMRDLGLLPEEEARARQREVIDSEGAWWTAVRPPLPEFHAENLRRVLVGPHERRRGIRVIDLELYDDSVVIRWHFVRVEPDRSGLVRQPPDEIEPVSRSVWPNFSLSDDVGTSYLRRGGGSLGRETDAGDFVAFGTAQFTPGLPRQAAQLRMDSRGAVFEVALR